MATSSSPLFNFLSLLIPSKPPPSKTLLPTIVSAQTSRTRDGSVSVPLISANETQPLSISHDVSSVVCPSLAYSNTLYFKSAYNVQVIVDDNEPEEKLLNRFRREVMRAGVIQECKRRRFFENKQDEKKRRTRDAAKRNRRRRPQSRLPPQGRQFDAPKTKKDDEEEDNWELPEGGIPS